MGHTALFFFSYVFDSFNAFMCLFCLKVLRNKDSRVKMTSATHHVSTTCLLEEIRYSKDAGTKLAVNVFSTDSNAGVFFKPER